MYTITETVSFDGADFDTLYASTLPHMNSGTFSWSLVGNPSTEEEKKEALKNRYNAFLDTSKVLRGVGLAWKKDETTIHIAAATFNSFDSDYITFIYALYGPDGNGSKSWLYDNDYYTETKNFFQAQYGVVGWKFYCVNNSSIMNYHMNKTSTPYDTTIEEVFTTPTGVEIAKIKNTYK